MTKLLSREQFNQQALKRDKYTCVFCREKATSVHHIMERKLFPDNGYYLDNAASVCDAHHWECEKTDLSLEAVRQACGIKQACLPPGWDASQSYDKWGNVVLRHGEQEKRDIGPMFFEDNVQKILSDKMELFD